MNYKKHIVLAVAILAIGTIANAQSNAPTIAIPGVTPVLTSTINIPISVLTNTPKALGASALAEITGWFISHGQVISGPGFTASGQYGATIGQAVTIFSTTNANEFTWSVVHNDFYNSKAKGALDEFGTGCSYTFKAPKWLSNFVILTTKPSQFTVGLALNLPTTDFTTLRFQGTDLLVTPTLGWKF